MSSREVSSSEESEPLEPGHARRLERLEQFAARALDFEAVLRVFERHVPTSLGLRALRSLAPLPQVEAKAALRRLDEMIRLQRAGDAPLFAGVCDPLPALNHARTAGRALDDESWMRLCGFLEAVQRLAQWLRERAAECPSLGALATGMPDFAELVESIHATVDERGRVRDHASPLLARLRRESSDVAERIEKHLRTIIARADVKAVLSDPNPARRGRRPVLAVKTKSQGRVPGIVHGRSQTGESVSGPARRSPALMRTRCEANVDRFCAISCSSPMSATTPS